MLTYATCYYIKRTAAVLESEKAFGGQFLITLMHIRCRAALCQQVAYSNEAACLQKVLVDVILW
jgi:hypothetical protein